MKILILASWYPKNEKDSSGKFIQVQATCTHRLPIPRGLQDFYLQKKLEVSLKLKNWIPDIIHAHAGYPAGVIGLQLKKKWNRPLVVTEHTGPINLLEPYFGSKKEMSHFYENCDGLIAVSEFQKGELAKYVSSKRIDVIGNIVEDCYFEPTPFPDQFSFCFIGALTQAKGAPALLDFASQYDNADGPPIQIHVLGKGPNLEAFREKSFQRLSFNLLDPAQHSVREVICASHALLLFSEVETFSLVAAESLASGRPVLGFDCGGPRDFVKDLTRERSVEALVQRVISLVDHWNESQSERLQTECRNAVMNYSSEKISESLQKFYRRWSS